MKPTIINHANCQVKLQTTDRHESCICCDIENCAVCTEVAVVLCNYYELAAKNEHGYVILVKMRTE